MTWETFGDVSAAIFAGIVFAILGWRFYNWFARSLRWTSRWRIVSLDLFKQISYFLHLFEDERRR